MPYCKRCGELCRTEKCHKCGSVIAATSSSTPLVDRWQSRYMGDVLDKKPALSSPLLTPQRRRPTVSGLWESTAKKVAPSPQPSCPGCQKELNGKTVRLPQSQQAYHWACLKCEKCKEPFEETSFHTDDERRIYHPKCAPELRRIQCGRCSQTIRDAYLIIRQRPLHSRCFRCTECQKVLQPSSMYAEHTTLPYCQPCSRQQAQKNSSEPEENFKIVPQFHPPPPHYAKEHEPKSLHKEPALPQQLPQAQPQSVHASSLMSRRGRPLPSFGQSKTCPGCCQRIASVHEERPGPRATRWHLKCLKCTGCSKALDSAATVHDGTGGALDPWCANCLLRNRKKGGDTTINKRVGTFAV
ncbi:hypothetical protein BCR43DRAFT_515671 [Syncephalastrum racemosum]|uniref:LIM zinc-binding domain-containing protein n=1 Tax=Syncephalastrum racemosum TaxID=13706 RepID=A0A1X2HA85_SYNRA|nr:hypothetical protein BCR43DRAFT_515671 [Syncephalastrum racemosum]